MPQFQELWAGAKHYRIEEFQPFAIVGGQLWAPAYIKEKWRILELDLGVARDGAGQVFALTGSRNIVSFVHAALKRDKANADRKSAG